MFPASVKVGHAITSCTVMIMTMGGSFKHVEINCAGLRSVQEGHPRVVFVITDGKSVNSEKLASFTTKVSSL